MSDSINICFNGCSFTVGEGFPIDLRDLYIYDRLLEKQFRFNRTNIAQGGSSNYTIFMRSAQAIMSGHYHCVITQWSALNRLWLHPGPDVDYFINDSQSSDFRYRDLYLGPKEKTTLNNTLLLLNGDYNNIIDLIKFSKILELLAEIKNVKIGFINGLVPWTDDLTRPLGNNLNRSLSDYSKSILDFTNRDDYEIVKFFQQLQDHFADINHNLWINLFDSFMKNCQDVGPEGHHPGINSHQWMADKTAEFLIKNKII